MRKTKLILVLAVTAGLLASCGQGSREGKATAAGGGERESRLTYSPDMAQCGGFTAADASAILGLPAGQLTSKSQKLYEGTWTCSFMTENESRGVSFTVTVSPSAAEAAQYMQQYRSHLEVAGETPQYKDLPAGAYSDIGGLGDEAIWTDVNGSLTARKGNITVQVLMPRDKGDQIKVVEAFLAKL